MLVGIKFYWIEFFWIDLGPHSTSTSLATIASEASDPHREYPEIESEFAEDPAVEERVSKLPGLDSEYRAKILKYFRIFSPTARHQTLDSMERISLRERAAYVDETLKFCSEQRKTSITKLTTKCMTDWSEDPRFGQLPPALNPAQKNHILGTLSMLRKRSRDSVLQVYNIY